MLNLHGLVLHGIDLHGLEFHGLPLIIVFIVCLDAIVVVLTIGIVVLVAMIIHHLVPPQLIP